MQCMHLDAGGGWLQIRTSTQRCHCPCPCPCAERARQSATLRTWFDRPRHGPQPAVKPLKYTTERSKWRFGIRYQHRCYHESTTRLLPSSRCSISGPSKGSSLPTACSSRMLSPPPLWAVGGRLRHPHGMQNKTDRYKDSCATPRLAPKAGACTREMASSPVPRTRGAVFSLSPAGRVLLTRQICSCICGARLCRESTLPHRRPPIAAATAYDERFNLQRSLLDCSIRTLKFRLFGRCPPVAR
jgi:hypothetical protein